MKIGEINVEIKKGDITEERVDAIVNAANNSLLGGGGVDGAIHRKGGPRILQQCIKHRGCPTGEARLTIGGDLPCKYVIHTVGPIYGTNQGMDERLLFNAYFNSLKLAEEYEIKTISFPSISTGAYSYPIDEAVEVVYKAIVEFSKIRKNIEKINLVLYSDENYQIYKDFFGNFS